VQGEPLVGPVHGVVRAGGAREDQRVRRVVDVEQACPREPVLLDKPSSCGGGVAPVVLLAIVVSILPMIFSLQRIYGFDFMSNVAQCQPPF
jgi:hypothetical protein